MEKGKPAKSEKPKSPKKTGKSLLQRWGAKPHEFAAVAIASLAMILTIWQGWETRNYNRLSTKPHIAIFTENYYDSGGVVIKIENDGVGPAIIDDIILSTGAGRTYQVSNLSANFWKSMFEDMKIPDSLAGKDLSHYFINPGGYIPATDEIDFFEYSGDKNEADHQKILAMLSSFETIEIQYHSIYNIKAVTRVNWKSENWMQR